METVFPAQYVTETLLPEVADALYAVCQEFGCDLRWTRDSREKPGTPEEFRAEPVTPSYSPPYGTKPHVRTEIRYGESYWHWPMRGASLIRGMPEGYVKFTASLDTFMSISKGLDLFDKTDDGRQRFLCWADKYELADGSTCFRLNTNAGFLWVRGADQNGVGTHMLHSGVADENTPPKLKGPVVVELVEYNFCRNIGGEPFYEQVPWDEMRGKDSTGRQWRIEKGDLSLYYTLRLNVVGRYNDRLKDRPRQVVEWPYQTALERWAGDDEKLLIPLDYC